MSSVFVASQSSCFFLCSREQIRLVENRLQGRSEVATWLFIYSRDDVICQQDGDTVVVNNNRHLYSEQNVLLGNSLTTAIVGGNNLMLDWFKRGLYNTLKADFHSVPIFCSV